MSDAASQGRSRVAVARGASLYLRRRSPDHRACHRRRKDDIAGKTGNCCLIEFCPFRKEFRLAASSVVHGVPGFRFHSSPYFSWRSKGARHRGLSRPKPRSGEPKAQPLQPSVPRSPLKVRRIGPRVSTKWSSNRVSLFGDFFSSFVPSLRRRFCSGFSLSAPSASSVVYGVTVLLVGAGICRCRGMGAGGGGGVSSP